MTFHASYLITTTKHPAKETQGKVVWGSLFEMPSITVGISHGRSFRQLVTFIHIQEAEPGEDTHSADFLLFPEVQDPSLWDGTAQTSGEFSCLSELNLDKSSQTC